MIDNADTTTAADISLPVAFLYSRGNHYYGEEEEEEENEEGVVEKAQTCVKLLSSLKDVSYDFAIPVVDKNRVFAKNVNKFITL